MRAFLAFVLLMSGVALVSGDTPTAAADGDPPSALMISGSTRPPAGDVAIRDLVIDLGFELTILDDDRDLGALDLSDVDLLLVSTSVSPSKVGVAFTTAPVPIVVWEPMLFEDLEIAHHAEESTFAYADVVISDLSHALAAGRSGTVPVFSLPRTLNTASVPFEADVIAHVPGRPYDPVIFGLEAFDRLADGTPSPAPRVGLFASYDGSRRLTTDGLALFAAAIEWAAGGTVVPTATNDDFADRATLVDTASATSLAATLEPGEDQPFFREDWSLWWTWTAPATGTVRLSATGGSIAAWRGDELATLDLVAFHDGAPTATVFVDVEAGDTLQVAVVDWDHSRGEVEVSAVLDTTARPANDHFADRLALVDSATGTNRGATLEPDERTPRDQEGSSVWWTWTAPRDGTATISTAGSDFDTVLAVWPSATPLRNVLVVNDDDGGRTSTVRFEVTAGTVYDLAVYGFGEAQGDIALSATVGTPAPPANDDFADRAPFVDSTTGSNVGASLEADEPTGPWSSGAEASVWFSWTAPRSATYTVTTRGSAIDTQASVWVGDAIGDLDHVVEASGHRDVRGPVYGQAEFSAAAGMTYQVAVYAAGATRGDVALAMIADDTAAPGNDDFADRLPLTDEATGTNVGATIEPGEPAIPIGRQPGGSVWWTWTAPETGTVSISTENTLFDTIVGIWSGDRVDELDLVVANDNTPWEDVEQSTAVFEAVAGESYEISVYGTERATGDVVLDVAYAPANDDFVDRLPFETTTTGTNVAATIEPGEPKAYEPTSQSVWWSWTAAETGPVTITTAGSSFLPILTVWTGDTLTDLELVGVADGHDSSATQFDLDAVAGTTYQLGLLGHDGAEGSIELGVRSGGAPPRAVMVAGSTRPPSGDRQVADLVRAAGYELEFVDDDSDLDALDLTDVDLLLISTSVVPRKVGDTFADADVHLITWEGHLFDELALAERSGESSASTRSIEILDATHPLAAGLNGTPNVYDSPHRLSYGLPGRSAAVIARETGRPNRAVVFGYPAWWPLVDGSSVSGARVALFADYDGARDLSPAGEALFAAALDWIA
ncbi:MAG: hypothetical protein AAFZ07_04885 [Actinomycetota bacterium]